MVGQLLGNYRVVGPAARAVTPRGLRVLAVLHEHSKQRALLVLPAVGVRATLFSERARALYLARDPGLGELLDCDQLPDGTPYLILEELEGETLRQRLDRFGRVPELAALLLGKQLAAALLAAHRKGVVPLGLHPDHVVLLPDRAAPGAERIKVLPTAQLVAEGGPAGHALGDGPRSAPYLAPEQCAEGVQADGRADVFALGLVLHEMLAGWHPLGGLTAAELAPAAAVPKIDPALGEDARRLLGRMLIPVAADRASMAQVLDELSRLTQRPTQELKLVASSFGRYRVLRKIGEGGMGTVFEAVNDDTGHHVAIKVLHQELAQLPQIVMRFLNEARTANHVNHPGIVNIYELGQLPERPPFIVMEYLEGDALSARVAARAGPFVRSEALALIQQVAEVMAAAHDKGVIHRDLKPENVMIVKDPLVPLGERVKVLDFGIAKVAAFFSRPEEQRKTRTGTVLGTPLYMAPEQCRGTTPATDRADVYSLGVMLFELLAGRVPFIAEAASELMAMHLYSQPPALGQFAPAAGAPVDALVGAMLAKDPQARPPMRQVAAELRWLEHRQGPELLTERRAVAQTQRMAPPPPKGSGPQRPAGPGLEPPRRADDPARPGPFRDRPAGLGLEPGRDPSPASPMRARWLVIPPALLLLGLPLWLAVRGPSGGPAGAAQDKVKEPARASAKEPPRGERPGDSAAAGGLATGGAARRPGAPAWTIETEGRARLLYGLWANGPDDIFAVGGGGVVLRWDGRAWQALPTGTTHDLYGVWGQGPDLFVVGEAGTILHSDRSGFRRMQNAGTENLSSVWGSRWDDVYAVGTGVIFHYGGRGWTREPMEGTTLNGVWGSGPGDVFAVGAGAAVLHRVGDRWVRQTVPVGGDRDLLCVGDSGPRDVYALGHGGVALRYDGTGWSLLPEEGVRRLTAYNLWVQGPGELYAVGSDSGTPAVLRYSRPRWTRLASPPGSEGDGAQELFAVWGVAEGSAASLLVAGKGGRLLRYRPRGGRGE